VVVGHPGLQPTPYNHLEAAFAVEHITGVDSLGPDGAKPPDQPSTSDLSTALSPPCLQSRCSSPSQLSYVPVVVLSKTGGFTDAVPRSPWYTAREHTCGKFSSCS